ncbi:MAG: hypothetical protein NVSMB31_09860 [Vulcanimicrobiaceae bacterium]
MGTALVTHGDIDMTNGQALIAAKLQRLDYANAIRLDSVMTEWGVWSYTLVPFTGTFDSLRGFFPTCTHVLEADNGDGAAVVGTYCSSGD